MQYSLGIIFKTSREAAGYSQEQAAELLGRSVRTISDYERDVTLPGIETMLKMANIYGDALLLCKLADPRFSEIKCVEPAEGAMKILDVMQEATNKARDLIKIVADNVIEEDELPIWKCWVEIADQMIISALTLKNIRIEKKKLSHGGNLVRV